MDDDEGIIRPMRRKGDPVVGRDAMVVMSRKDLAFLIHLKKKKTTARFNMDTFRLFQVEAETGGPFSIFGPFLGAPQAVMGAERMIALGVKRLWILGCCGSIHPELRIGDLLIPTQSFCGEGTSQHYPVGEKTPASDEGLNRLVEGHLQKIGHPFSKGTVWTTDAPFRETPKKVRELQQYGVLAVEMEMSALMTLALYRGVKLAGLLVVSDELFDMKWRPGFSKSVFKESCRAAGEILFQLLESRAEGNMGENHGKHKGTARR